MTVSAALAAELRALVGDRHVLDRASALLVYESDALPGYRKRPAVAVFPGSRDEAIAVVRALAAHRVPFVPRGAGTGLSGGALANDVVLVGMNRMRRIVSIDADARVARVEPGVVNASLTLAATPHGLHYAPDPSSQTACTIGGNVAENAGGPHCLKYGVTLNHVVGATVALPDGSIAELRSPRDSREGYDLLGAFVGSEGCFGLAVDIDVRLMPNPEDIRTLLADFSTVDDAARATSAIIASGIVPAACELMDQGIILAVESSIYAAGYPKDAAAVLLVELDGSRAAVSQDSGRVEEICREHGARDVRVASDAADRARLWQGRKKAFGAMGRMAPHLAVQDAVVPRTRLAEILARISEIAARHGIRVCNVFHAGDGNLHPNIPYDGRNPGEAERVHDAMHEIMSLCIESGGTITGEHGVGLDKLPYMDALFTADTLDAMCRLRTAFDPERRANPGKVVPVKSCREWAGTPATRASAAPSAMPAGTTPARTMPAVAPADQRIADAIATARASRSRIFISGAGTRAAAPDGHAHSLSVPDRDNVIAYVPADLTITVGAGMTLGDLAAITAEHGQWCPLLPWGSDRSTVGGTLSTGSRGPASAALGAPRDLAIGLTFVDGRSTVVTAGGRVVKNVAGFDLTRMMVGSWGSLGVITAASLRLRALPPVRETWVVPTHAIPIDALRAFVRGPFAPMACEEIPGSVATTFASDESHFVIWLGGGMAHVAAARAALRAIAPAREVDGEVWTTIRARGPFVDRAPRALSSAVSAVNERVKQAFDPDDVFLSPMLAATSSFVHA